MVSEREEVGVFPKRRPGRRLPVAAAAVLALVLMLSSCTRGDGSSPSPSPSASATSTGSPSASSSDAPVTLRFDVYGDPVVVAAYQALAKAYTEAHPRVTVKVASTPDEGTAEARLDQQFTDGTAPDLFLTDSTQLPTLVSGDRVQPVDQLLEDRDVTFGDSFERLGLEAFAADSRLECMPNDVSPYVVFYNRRLVQPLDLPTNDAGRTITPAKNGWTWEQFTRTAEFVSGAGVKGAYLPATLTTLTPLLRSAGTDIVDDPVRPTTLTLNSKVARSALEKVLDVVRNRRVAPTARELRRSDAATRFASGKLAMMVGTRALVPGFRQQAGLRFDVYPLPSLGRFRTVADVSGYCISRTSQHVSAAADFLAFASSKKGAELTTQSGGMVPANLAALHSPVFQQRGQFPLRSDIFSRVIRRTDVMPNPLEWPAMVSGTQPLVDRLFYGRSIDLDTLLPRIDTLSASLLTKPTPSPSPSASPSANPSASPSASPSSG